MSGGKVFTPEEACEAAFNDGVQFQAQQDKEMLAWAYSKLVYRSFDNQDDGLMMDRINLLLQYGVSA